MSLLILSLKRPISRRKKPFPKALPRFLAVNSRTVSNFGNNLHWTEMFEDRTRQRHFRRGTVERIPAPPGSQMATERFLPCLRQTQGHRHQDFEKRTAKKYRGWLSQPRLVNHCSMKSTGKSSTRNIVDNLGRIPEDPRNRFVISVSSSPHLPQCIDTQYGRRHLVSLQVAPGSTQMPSQCFERSISA